MWELIKMIVLGSFLLIEGIRDLKSRKVSVVSAGIYAIIGVVLQFPILKECWISLSGGIVLGLVIILIAKVTAEKIGYGDGIIITVSGIYLGFRENFILFSTGLFLSAMTSVVLLLCRKAGKKTELPFVSFLFVGYALTCVAQI